MRDVRFKFAVGAEHVDYRLGRLAGKSVDGYLDGRGYLELALLVGDERRGAVRDETARKSLVVGRHADGGDALDERRYHSYGRNRAVLAANGHKGIYGARYLDFAVGALRAVDDGARGLAEHLRRLDGNTVVDISGVGRRRYLGAVFYRLAFDVDTLLGLGKALRLAADDGVQRGIDDGYRLDSAVFYLRLAVHDLGRNDGAHACGYLGRGYLVRELGEHRHALHLVLARYITVEPDFAGIPSFAREYLGRADGHSRRRRQYLGFLFERMSCLYYGLTPCDELDRVAFYVVVFRHISLLSR